MRSQKSVAICYRNLNLSSAAAAAATAEVLNFTIVYPETVPL